MMNNLNFSTIDQSWQECLDRGLAHMSKDYLQDLQQSQDWLPGPEKIFNTFSLPLDRVQYILLGESPYPRRESANGFAFWDAQVKEIWSPTGLSKKANRATSLRNLLKMMLVAEGCLDRDHLTQVDIAKIDKNALVETNEQLFNNFLQHGFLLLNASLVLQSKGSPQKDAKAWLPFMREVLNCLLEKRPEAKLILFGRIAHEIDAILGLTHAEKIHAEHPYNYSFITNQKVLDFFKPLHLLRKKA